MRKNHRLFRKIRKAKILFHQSEPLLLDMQLENHGTNIAKQPKFLKFSKLYDIGNPLRLFESFVYDALVDMVVGNTKL